MKTVEYSINPNVPHNGNVRKGDKKRHQLPLQKSFRKKEHLYDHESQKKEVKKRMISVSKSKEKQNKFSQAIQVSPIKRSGISPRLDKTEKKIQKLSLRDNSFKQPLKITMLEKLLAISRIFEMDIHKESNQILQSLYQKNENYQALLEYWQKKQMYEESDKILYQLIQNYLKIIEQFAVQSLQKLQLSLENYENVLKQLEQENNKLKYENRQLKDCGQIVISLTQKVEQLFQRSKFSSYVICSISTYGLDVENFVSKILMNHLQNQYSLPKLNFSLHINNEEKRIFHSENSEQIEQMQASNINKLSIKSEMRQRVPYKIIEDQYSQFSLH